jgi:hypothetical protein
MAALMERIFEQCHTFRNAGQEEYAHDDSDAFANFKRGASEFGDRITPLHVLWIYAMKHKDGIASYINGHTSQREDVRGRIADLIVYLCLLWGLVDEKEEAEKAAREAMEGMEQ